MKGRGRYALNGTTVQTFAECQSLLDSRDSVIQSSLMYLYGRVGVDRTLQLADFRPCRLTFVCHIYNSVVHFHLNRFASKFQAHNSITVFITGHCAGVSIPIN